MRLIISLTVLAVMLAATSLQSQECPGGDPGSGYPIAATFDGAMPADSAWLAAVAGASAYRWRVPSRRRNAYAGWERVQRRLLPPEPRWADDWSPEASHRAVLRVVLFRNERKPRVDVIKPSGDKRFDETVASMVEDPMPASPALPGLPPGSERDSIVVHLTLGDIPSAGVQGVVRFAAVQTRVELVRNSLQVVPTVGTSPGRPASVPPVTVKYDVRENGTVDEASIEFLSGAASGMEMAIREGLRLARFKPATSNCRPIAQSVVQTFGR